MGLPVAAVPSGYCEAVAAVGQWLLCGSGCCGAVAAVRQVVRCLVTWGGFEMYFLPNVLALKMYFVASFAP